jgi:hypothetical protein
LDWVLVAKANGAGVDMLVVNNAEHGFRIAEAAGCSFNPFADQVIARQEQGVLWGGNIYTGYTGSSIHLHMAGFRHNWANREFLWTAFDYPFTQLKCNRVFGQVPESNTKALEIDLKLGFKIVARIDDVFPDGACLVLSLAREDCRWLKLKPRDIKTVTET